MGFVRAQRQKSKLRMGLFGPSGSGKTYSALLIAKGFGGKTACIDTENGSAQLYAHLLDFDVATLDPPFAPKRYVELIHEAEEAGYQNIIIDSLSHAWTGEGGMLDMHDRLAAGGKENSYSAWRHVTPEHNRLVDAILRSPCHMIVCGRSKTEYVQEEVGGRKTIKKMGTSPEFRNGIEYEFTITFDLGMDHSAVATKDRTSIFDGIPQRLSVETARELIEWLDQGVEAPERLRFADLRERAIALWGDTMPQKITELTGAKKSTDLTQEHLRRIREALDQAA